MPELSKVRVPVATGFVVVDVELSEDAGIVTLYVQVLLAVFVKATVSVWLSPSESVTFIGVEKFEVLSALADEFRFILRSKLCVATG